MIGSGRCPAPGEAPRRANTHPGAPRWLPDGGGLESAAEEVRRVVVAGLERLRKLRAQVADPEAEPPSDDRRGDGRRRTGRSSASATRCRSSGRCAPRSSN